MASFNKVILMGNLTRDPELRYTPNGAPVTELGIAVNRVYTTKDGDRREEVTFVDVTVWNRQAETCCQYLKKGRPVHVEGFLKLDSWDDKTTGEKRSKLKIEAERVQFIGSQRDDAGGGGGKLAGRGLFRAGSTPRAASAQCSQRAASRHRQWRRSRPFGPQFAAAPPPRSAPRRIRRGRRHPVLTATSIAPWPTCGQVPGVHHGQDDR